MFSNWNQRVSTFPLPLAAKTNSHHKTLRKEKTWCGAREITSSSQRKGVAFGFNLIGNAHRIGYRINGSCVTKEPVSSLLDFVLTFAIYVAVGGCCVKIDLG